MTYPQVSQNFSVAAAANPFGNQKPVLPLRVKQLRLSTRERQHHDVSEPWPTDQVVRRVREICDQKQTRQ